MERATMPRSRIFVFVLLLVILGGLVTPVHAQSDIQVIRDAASLTFPDSLLFSAEFQGGANITSVVLEYGVNQLTCGTVDARAFPQVTPGTDVKVTWTWQMLESGSLATGTTVWWHWQVTDSSGIHFTSPAKTAPVYAEWPADVLPRARVHASIIAHIAAEHFCEHQPYHRLEKHLERIGVDLPRVCQVSLMAQLNERMQPLVTAIQAQVFGSGYIHLDATPIDLYDPDRPGAVRESTLWAYRAADGPVWFEFQLSKSPTHPTQRLARYYGLLQTDGATGLDQIGQADHRPARRRDRDLADLVLVLAVFRREANH